MAGIELRDLVKKFKKVVAVDHVNLSIEDKEYLVLVGPSGCGKTTVLRMIAGLEEPTEGEIYIGNRKVNNVAPKDRDIAMVFQNYALYPHMSVYDNMSFGLRLRKLPKEDIKSRVNEASGILGIAELSLRKPKELSGGQRQRVAMGRAIVRKPQVFLFDEPLSNLDAKLRVQMRAELSRLYEALQTTVVYVTHDQIEAMTLASRIVVMNQGTIMQTGPPMEVYNNPCNLFVAGFIGSPAMNFVEISVIEEHGSLFLLSDTFKIAIPNKFYERFGKATNRNVIWGIRPQDIYDGSLEVAFPGSGTLRVIVDVCEPIGSEVIVLASCGNAHFTACIEPKTQAKPHKEMDFLFDMNKMYLFDKETEKVY
jgi:multiple sugar transport system ATP-binding protein